MFGLGVVVGLDFVVEVWIDFVVEAGRGLAVEVGRGLAVEIEVGVGFGLDLAVEAGLDFGMGHRRHPRSACKVVVEIGRAWVVRPGRSDAELGSWDPRDQFSMLLCDY